MPQLDIIDLQTENEAIDALRGEYDEENCLIPRYRAYARGHQPNALTENQKRILGTHVAEISLSGGEWSLQKSGIRPGAKGAENPRADNLMHQVVAEGADRVELTGFDVEDKPVAAFIEEVSVKNALPDIQGEVNYDTQRDGNHAIRVLWKPNGNPPRAEGGYGRILLRKENWWDGREGIWCTPETSDLPECAINEYWVYTDAARTEANAVKRRIVYYDDRIERFQRARDAKEWTPYTFDGQPAIIEWLKPDGSPLHIPYVHFPNAGRMWGHQGISELSGGLLSQQDDVNLLDASEVAAAVLTAFQILKISGYTPQPDLDNLDNPGAVKPYKFEAEAGLYLYDANPNFDVSAIPAGSIEQIKLAKDDKIATIARMTRTPRHAITGGDWPSGDALVRAEQPSVSKAKRQAAKWGPCWATVMHRAVEQANVFGKRGLNEDALITATWGDFERRDPLFVAEVEEAEIRNEALRANPTLALPAVNRFQQALQRRGNGQPTTAEV